MSSSGAYVSKKADASTVEAVEEWMNSKDFNEIRWNEISEIYAGSEGVGVPTSQREDAKARFLAYVGEDASPATLWTNWLKYAAAVVVLVASSFWVYWNVNTVTVKTAYGEQREIALPDGSKVWLNAASELVLFQKFPAADRFGGRGLFRGR